MHATRPIALSVAAALVTGAIASPAWASHRPARPTHDKATELALKAGRSTVAPKHKLSLTATLKSANRRLASEELWLERRDAGTNKFGDPVDIGPTDANGQFTVPIAPGNHQGNKTQYRVVFQGDTGYRASHSSIITVTVAASTG
jgi:hypothetical protein